MKWPKSLLFVRHAESAYNTIAKSRKEDPDYQEFVRLYQEWSLVAGTQEPSEELKHLAKIMADLYRVNASDQETPLNFMDGQQYSIMKTGEYLRHHEVLPDVIFVSPYLRTRQTLEYLICGWPELSRVRVYEDERIREQSHGLSGLYNDHKIFFLHHPEQFLLYQLEGPYWYKWPQGENVPEVRSRLRSWLATVTREFAEQNVFVVSHHLTLLGLRANFERLTVEEFLRIDKEEKPVNLGVTKYVGDPTQGRDGRFLLDYYNSQFF